MMLEWGWDKYVSNIETIEGSPNTPPKVTIEQMGSTVIEEDWFEKDTFTQRSMLSKIKAKRLQTQGNYDAFFGKVTNFSWSVNPDGKPPRNTIRRCYHFTSTIPTSREVRY